MNLFKKTLLGVLVTTSLSFAAPRRDFTFAAHKETTLAAASETFTVQKPAAEHSRHINFVEAIVYCDVACDITIEVDGASAAGATALTEVPLTFGTNSADAFHSSDVGAGSVIAVYHLKADETREIDLSMIRWNKNDGLRTLTIKTGNVSGDVRISIIWTED